MWQQSFTKFYPAVHKAAVWQAWTDVANWPQWDSELAYCEPPKTFAAGNHFVLKPKSGPKVKLTLSAVEPLQHFTDSCRFPGAIMYDEHQLIETDAGIQITNTIRVTGPLRKFWAWLVARKVAASVPTQTDNLINYVRQHHD